MIDWLIIIVLAIFCVSSVLDIKFRAVPSVILTGMIFVVLLLRPENLLWGIAGLVFGILIRDLLNDVAGMDFGMADIKFFIIIGLLISNLYIFITMLMIFVILQFVYTIFWKWKFGYDESMPFLPCLTAVYFVLFLLGGVA